MPSRKGPSQRDPMVRLSQAVRTAAPASMGGRVTNASAVPPQPRKATRAPDGGSGDSDHDGAGAHSTAVGTDATATGINAVAVGDDATASDTDDTAVGRVAV